MKEGQRVTPIILCGGIGKRLYPLSREQRPKQFIKLFSKNSTFQKTIRRISNTTLFSPPICVTHKTQYDLVLKQVTEVAFTDEATIIKETSRKNTAAAIIGTTLYLKKIRENEPLLILPSDHVIAETGKFEDYIKEGLLLLKTHPDSIICFGIKPQTPHTGYGYIQKKNGTSVTSFTEKPNIKKAKEYLLSGNYLWNSGIFLCHSRTIAKNAEEYCPQIIKTIEIDINHKKIQNDNTPNISFDHAIMEKTANIQFIEADISWSDIGSWTHFLKHLTQSFLTKYVHEKP